VARAVHAGNTVNQRDIESQKSGKEKMKGNYVPPGHCVVVVIEFLNKLVSKISLKTEGTKTMEEGLCPLRYNPT
jgi:hypothetical protein